MQQAIERRRHSRKVGYGLVALIDGRAHPVIDISTHGISYQSGTHRAGAVITMKIARLTDISDCIEGRITVVSAEETITRGEFKPTMALMSYIIGHIGEATGTEPAYFRK